MVSLEHVLIFSLILFALGLFGALLRRNLLMVLLSIEIMLNAASFSLMAISSFFSQIDGHVMFIFILVVLSSEVAVALGIILRYHEKYHTLDIDEMNH